MKQLHNGFYWPKLSQEQRDECYNGMGAEWMPEFSRKTLDWLFGVLEEAVRRHDVDFAYYTEQLQYHAANDRMKENMIYLAQTKIPWWRWFKRRRFIKYWIPLLYMAVESSLGWKAFSEAEKKKI